MIKGLRVDNVGIGIIPEGKLYIYSINVSNGRADFQFLRYKSDVTESMYNVYGRTATIDGVEIEYALFKLTVNSYNCFSEENHRRLVMLFSDMDGEYEILSEVMAKEIKQDLVMEFHDEVSKVSASYYKMDKLLNQTITGKNKALD